MLPMAAGETIVMKAREVTVPSAVEPAAMEPTPAVTATTAVSSVGEVRLEEHGSAQYSGCDSSQSPSYPGPGSIFA
jgi:hypothetical protein